MVIILLHTETSCGIIEQEPGMLETLVTCVTCAEHMNLPDTARFDLHVLVSL